MACLGLCLGKVGALRKGNSAGVRDFGPQEPAQQARKAPPNGYAPSPLRLVSSSSPFASSPFASSSFASSPPWRLGGGGILKAQLRAPPALPLVHFQPPGQMEQSPIVG